MVKAPKAGGMRQGWWERPGLVREARAGERGQE